MVEADVLLTSSIPGLVTMATFHLKKGIYSVQSVCQCARICTVSAHIQTVCVCVCLYAGAFTDYSNSPDSH